MEMKINELPTNTAAWIGTTYAQLTVAAPYTTPHAPTVIGSDVAGEIVDVGTAVARFRVED